jgi:hypothetical protein
MLRAIINLAVLAAIIWAAWSLWHWQFGAGESKGAASYAAKSCVDEARGRYDISGARTHSVEENRNGFVVKGSMTLRRGGTAKLTCLTNHNGRVTEVMVAE